MNLILYEETDNYVNLHNIYLNNKNVHIHLST